MITVGILRRCLRSIGALLLGIAFVALSVDQASAEGEPGGEALTARLQDIPDEVNGLVVVWGGKKVSAVPPRVRLAQQASPLAYSLDVRRRASYGDSYVAVPYGSEDKPYLLSQVGVRNPLPATLIARGGAPSDSAPVPAETDFEAAARQTAIWASSGILQLDKTRVPNARLRNRAQQLLTAAEGGRVPLQPSIYGVAIFIRETTATTVTLAITLTVNANTSLESSQKIDLYLDGQRVEVQTAARTDVTRTAAGGYAASAAVDLGDHGSREIAEVVLDRNTKVIDASAVWVNVVSEPGLVLVSDGASPPLITGENAVMNFRTNTRLNPDDYVGPRQILNKTGTYLLTRVPEGLVLMVVVLALYLIPRTGRLIDRGIQVAATKVKGKSEERHEEPQVVPQSVVVEAANVDEAVRIGAAALGKESSALHVLVLRDAKRGWLTRRLVSKAKVQVSGEKGPPTAETT